MADEPLLVTSALEAVFPSGDGVGPIDLVVERGEALLVVGPSGSGKSTLLRMLHGAVPQAVPARVTGRVAVAGREVGVHRMASLADAVGVLAQDPESGVCMPGVEDEVAFPLENLAVHRDRIEPAVAAALERVGATGLRSRRTTELSGGELQLVALAATTAAEPPLLLLDEPTSMLDGDGVRAVRAAIAEVRARTGAAHVLVEHRLDELAGDAGLGALPARWLVLSRSGRVLHDGPPRAIGAPLLRRLLAEGCWLPVELELRALLDADADDGAEALEDRAIGLALAAAAAGPGVPPAAGPAVLRARGLAVAPRDPFARRSARHAPVLDGVDLELRSGETVALVGANGSGKSTLLACLAGIARPLAGTVEAARAGLVFQHPEHQFTAATVRAEVAHGLGPDAEARVEAMLARFGLAEHAERDPHRLSGGQQRRLSLAAMLVHERPLLLADEPTFGLDRRGTIEVLRALREAAGTRAVLFSSHDLRSVAGYADRVLVIGGGRLLADVEPLALLRDQELLEAARLRPSRLLRRIATAVERTADLQQALRALDDRAAQAPLTAAAGSS